MKLTLEIYQHAAGVYKVAYLASEREGYRIAGPKGLGMKKLIEIEVDSEDIIDGLKELGALDD